MFKEVLSPPDVVTIEEVAADVEDEAAVSVVAAVDDVMVAAAPNVGLAGHSLAES